MTHWFKGWDIQWCTVSDMALFKCCDNQWCTQLVQQYSLATGLHNDYHWSEKAWLGQWKTERRVSVSVCADHHPAVIRVLHSCTHSRVSACFQPSSHKNQTYWLTPSSLSHSYWTQSRKRENINTDSWQLFYTVCIKQKWCSFGTDM